jgi:hypothetical protein
LRHGERLFAESTEANLRDRTENDTRRWRSSLLALTVRVPGQMAVSGALSGHSKSCNAVTTLNKSAQHGGEQ